MKITVIFVSKYGTTSIISNKITASVNKHTIDVINLEECPEPDMSGYDIILLGSPVYAGKILKSMDSFCKENQELLLSKKLALFVCGMHLDREVQQKELKEAYPAIVYQHAFSKVFLGGQFLFEKMNFIERFLVKRIAKTKRNVSNINEEEIREFANMLNQLS